MSGVNIPADATVLSPGEVAEKLGIGKPANANHAVAAPSHLPDGKIDYTKPIGIDMKTSAPVPAAVEPHRLPDGRIDYSKPVGGMTKEPFVPKEAAPHAPAAGKSWVEQVRNTGRGINNAAHGALNQTGDFIGHVGNGYHFDKMAKDASLGAKAGHVTGAIGGATHATAKAAGSATKVAFKTVGKVGLLGIGTAAALGLSGRYLFNNSGAER